MASKIHESESERKAKSQELDKLGKWMRRARAEARESRACLGEKHIHDLRVALRRCRSVAAGMEELDPSPAWRKMHKASKELLEGVSEVRDAHVLQFWIRKLGMAKAKAGLRLAEKLYGSEHHARHKARKALKAFDSKQWKKWTDHLPDRAYQIPSASPAFELIALQRWQEAWGLHHSAMRLRSRISFHQLRIGLKGIRYTVESFLPKLAERWGGELKRLQDLLGEVHDLDVLQAAMLGLRPKLLAAERKRWRKVIAGERSQRLTTYREKMTGPKARWPVWRRELPEGRALERAQIEWLAVWASFLDPHPVDARRVTRLALQLFDGIVRLGFPLRLPVHARELLEAAGTVRDVGRVEGDRGHQKTSFRLISRKTPPQGWTSRQMLIVAQIARYHRGRLPDAMHEVWAGNDSAQQEGLAFLIGILRLATTFGTQADKPVTRLKVSESANVLRIIATGYRQEEPLASNLASVRHLLENVLHRPITIEGVASQQQASNVSAPMAAAN